jgi:hypothetical protein
MPQVNPDIVYREELDNWAILFDPDTGDSFGLNPTSSFIWKGLSEGKEKETIIADLTSIAEGVPATVGDDYDTFIAELTEKGYLAQ